MIQPPGPARPFKGGIFSSLNSTRSSVIAMSGGQLLLPLEAVSQPANSDVQPGGTLSTVPDSGDRRLRCFKRVGLNSTRHFCIAQAVVRRNFIKDLFGRVHKPNNTRMNSFRQCANGRLFDKLNSRLNTEGRMKKTPAQLGQWSMTKHRKIGTSYGRLMSA